MLFGILTKVVVQQLPVTAHKIFCFNRWTAGVGEFTEQVKIIAPDGATTICENKTKRALRRFDYCIQSFLESLSFMQKKVCG